MDKREATPSEERLLLVSGMPGADEVVVVEAGPPPPSFLRIICGGPPGAELMVFRRIDQSNKFREFRVVNRNLASVWRQKALFLPFRN